MVFSSPPSLSPGPRQTDGLYWTGRVHPQKVNFPGGERSRDTAAAIVILANNALRACHPTAGLFRGQGLPAAMDVPVADFASPRRLFAGCGPDQDPQRAGRLLLGEGTGFQGGAVQLVGRPAAGGRIGEDVVDGEQAADRHLGVQCR